MLLKNPSSIVQQILSIHHKTMMMIWFVLKDTCDDFMYIYFEGPLHFHSSVIPQGVKEFVDLMMLSGRKEDEVS